MKSLKTNFPIILLILFETAIGVLLLLNPEVFTRTVIILFGVVLLMIGVTYLVRYLREKKKEKGSVSTLIISVVSLIAGAVFAACSGLIVGFVTVIAVIYGVVLAVFGIYKLQNYFQSRKAKNPVSKVSMISGVVAVVVGAVIIIYPKEAAFSVWTITGIALLAEAVIDFLSVIQSVRIGKDSE